MPSGYAENYADSIRTSELKFAVNLNNFRQALSILLVALIPYGMAHGQRRDRTIFQFQHTGWTAKDGAPGSAWALEQTPDGYLWMGTPTGLYRFDGIRFELYQPPSGQRFRSDYILRLKATPDGGLWIGFRNGGADFLKDGRITSYGVPEGLPRGSVQDFALDRNGVVWAATYGGLGRFDGSHWQSIGPDWGLTGKLALDVFLDREGTVWVASEDSLFALLHGSHQFRKCADHLGRTTTIGQTPDGTLWLSERQRGGLAKEFTFRAIRPTPALPRPDGRALPRMMEIDAVNSTFIDHTGSLWINTTDGLFRVQYPERLPKNTLEHLDQGTAQVFRQKGGLTSDLTDQRATIEDSQGDVWVATATGLDRFRESNVVPITTDNYREILVAGNQGDAWTSELSFPHLSLVHLRGLTTSSQPIQVIPSAAYRDSNGVIWLGSPKGLFRLENGRLVRYPLPAEVTRFNGAEDVQAITSDTTGGVWVSLRGIYRWRNGVWAWFGDRDDLFKDGARSLLTDSIGRIWFGYQDGKIALVDRDRLKKFSVTDGLQVGGIQPIYEHAGRIWIGGERGLALYRNDRFQSLTPDGDAAFAGVSGIVETANGDLWVNATPGIFHIQAGEIERAIKEPAYHVRCELFDVLDGLNGNALQARPIPTAVESSDGRLWFETTAGVVQIDPAHLLRNALPPSVYVRSVDAGGVTHSTLGAINLPSRTTNIHIAYTAPDLSIPERVRYRYQLEGSDRSWQDVGTRREAFYTNLGPGHYRFHVIACNENGVWNEEGAYFDFRIAPAWFETRWFQVLCIGLFLLLLWALYQLRLKQLERQFNITLQTRVDERTRIARELHDTLLQSFQGLLLRFQTVSNLLPAKPEEAKTRIDSVIEEGSDAITEGRDAVHEIRSMGLVTADLAQSIRSFAKELLGNLSIEKQPEFRVQVEGSHRNLNPIVRDETYRIAAEALRNAIRHAGAKRIEVEVRYDEKHLTLRIRDDGKGIDASVLDKEHAPGHWGLRGIRERARLMGGSLEIWSKPGSGAEIELKIPATSAYVKPSPSQRSFFLRTPWS